MLARHFRRDGTPYPEGDAGLFEWAADLEDMSKRVVKQETLWNGIFLSTVWLGLDHRFCNHDLPPIIFETMAFNHLVHDYMDLTMDRYCFEWEAKIGHETMKREVGSILFTLKMWWGMILEDYHAVN